MNKQPACSRERVLRKRAKNSSVFVRIEYKKLVSDSYIYLTTYRDLHDYGYKTISFL